MPFCTSASPGIWPGPILLESLQTMNHIEEPEDYSKLHDDGALGSANGSPMIFRPEPGSRGTRTGGIASPLPMGSSPVLCQLARLKMIEILKLSQTDSNSTHSNANGQLRS